MTLPEGFQRTPPEPKPEPVLASAIADNLVYMNQMTTTEVWSSSDVSSDNPPED